MLFCLWDQSDSYLVAARARAEVSVGQIELFDAKRAVTALESGFFSMNILLHVHLPDIFVFLYERVLWRHACGRGMFAIVRYGKKEEGKKNRGCAGQVIDS